MNKKNAFTMLVLLSLLLTQLAFAPQITARTAACDAAQFVADVTIPDGTPFNAGDSFDKTWRLKNVGSCSWSTSYNLVFDTGNQMNAAASAPFSKSVAPGETIDLTVRMTAPAANGLFRGYWKLKNAAGVLFGIGAAADKSFWVEIRVAASGGSTGYDFVQNAASATWTSGAGTLPFPGAADDANGAGLKVDNPKLEDGSLAGAPGLLMVPQNVYNGFVQAQYPVYHVQSGDHFQSIVNCDYNATACYVNFRLDYQVGSGPVNTFWSFNERYEGLYYRADRDISSLAGQDVKFILRIGAAGYANGDRAVWDAPRIANAGGVPPTATGTPSTPTLTPVPSSGCDRLTFVSDLDVPDGKVFAPGAAFTKTWRVKNTGTCTWTTSYKLVLVSGDPMGAASTEINLTSTIAPNTTVDIPVKLIAPATAGSYRGYWQFKNKDGALFGLGASADKPFWVDILVSGSSPATAAPTVTGTPPTPTATSSLPSPTPNVGPDRATFIADLSVPDGAIFASSVAFRKTWRIRNTGASTWGAGYKLVFAGGNQMSGPAEAPLPSSVAPNTTVDISVDLISPASVGPYRGYWQLKNASGALFGIGPAANTPFWVDILVTSSGGPTPTPTALALSGPTPTVTATLQPSGSYAVVGITKTDGTLNVRSAAGASNPLVGSLAYNATDIGKLGSPGMVGSAEWWQVRKAGVTGWVNAFYLTEYLPPAAFCSDAKVTTLLTNLGTALKNADGAALAALVSPKHGVDIRLATNNTPVNYTQTTVASVFTSTTAQNWGPGAASGAPVSGTFKDIIQPKLLDVYNSSYQLSCNDTSKVGTVSQPWPSEYTTINLYSIYKPATAAQQDWRDFLVGIEYVNGQPYLFSLVHFQWTP
ncbi:MAG: NBR1-Ig-like domain-containing protein [Anaerolineales bacterium]